MVASRNMAIGSCAIRPLMCDRLEHVEVPIMNNDLVIRLRQLRCMVNQSTYVSGG